MTDNILLTRLQGKKGFAYLPGVGARRTRTVDAMGRQRREGWLQRCPLSHDQARCIHRPSVEWLCDPSVFYRIWFWPSADAESTKPDHDEKSLHRHTIPCFAWSKSPFELQLGSRETPHASHPETEEERCPRRNQRRGSTSCFGSMRAVHSPTWSQNGRTRSQ